MPTSPERAAQEFQRSVRAHRAALDRLLDRRSGAALKKYYDQAQDRLERMLARMARGARQEPLTPLQAQQLLQQVREAQQTIARKLAQTLRPVLTEAQQEGIDQTTETMEVLDERLNNSMLVLPTSDVAYKSRLVDQRAAVLDKANDSAWLNFGAALVTGLSSAAAMSLSLQETPMDTVARLREAADDNWWRGERIIHTEMAYAYNQAQADTISEVAPFIEGLGKRWCELVDDATGLPLDNRVGADSIVLHGQVTEYSGLFVMPPDPMVHRSFWNKSWFSSPNRPNDRSITMPWRRSWGIPGWRWVNNQRVPVNSGT